MNTPAQTRPTQATVSAYERLRTRGIEFHSRIDGELGLSVFLRHGMLAWTRAYSSVLIEARTSPLLLDTTRIPSPLHDDIIDVMVTMATCASRSFHKGELSV